MMMVNMRGILWGVFGILFMLSIASTALGQQSDSALTQSQFMQIIDRIDKAEESMRDHVDKKFGELDTKIDDLNTKFHELDKKVAVLRSDVDKLFTIIIGIALAVGAHLLIFIGSHIYSYWRNKANLVPKVAAEVVTERQRESDTSLGKASSIDTTQSDSSLPEE